MPSAHGTKAFHGDHRPLSGFTTCPPGVDSILTLFLSSPLGTKLRLITGPDPDVRSSAGANRFAVVSAWHSHTQSANKYGVGGTEAQQDTENLPACVIPYSTYYSL